MTGGGAVAWSGALTPVATVRAMTRTPIAVAVALIVVGVGTGAVYLTQTTGATPAPGATSSPAAPAPRAADPYQVYVKIAPDGAPNLSREDAQTRALLGCGQPWAPGTVDAALAEAYADLCKDR